jgi:hypothetical protein
MLIEGNTYYSLRELVDSGIIPLNYMTLWQMVKDKQILATNFSTGSKRKRWKILGSEVRRFLNNRTEKIV